MLAVKKKALIAMSGGVDSSVAAFLTQQAGFDCLGAMMHLHTHLDTRDAENVARQLEFDLEILDYTDFFRQTVMDSFADCYRLGKTPNPCIVCNRYLKFGALLEQALQLGCDAIVTGHYARIRQDTATDRFLLLKAADPAKDQSYFLYSLTQHQLAHTRFPLGELSKDRVREIAAAQGFTNAGKKDSQDICFVPGGDYVAFLEGYLGTAFPSGDFLDMDGRPLGRHRGAIAYTRGQRKGLGLALGEPVYVQQKDMDANTVTVGPDKALYGTSLLACDLNWIAFEALTAPLRCGAKTRSRMTEQPATLYPQADGRVLVVFDEPQRAITEGQAVVFYDGDTVLGGGTIDVLS